MGMKLSCRTRTLPLLLFPRIIPSATDILPCWLGEKREDKAEAIGSQTGAMGSKDEK